MEGDEIAIVQLVRNGSNADSVAIDITTIDWTAIGQG